MLASGGNLLRTLDMLKSESRNRGLGRVLESIRMTLDEGGSFSAALAEQPRVFTPLFVSVVGLIGMTIFFLLFRRIPRTKYWLDIARIRSPILGPFLVAGELSRFSRTLAMLLEADVPLSTALQLGIGSCKNQRLVRAFKDAEDSLLARVGGSPETSSRSPTNVCGACADGRGE